MRECDKYISESLGTNLGKMDRQSLDPQPKNLHQCVYDLIPEMLYKNTPSEQSSAPEVMEQKGNVLIRDLWKQGTESVQNMRVVNTDALTYQTKAPEKCLYEAEKGKKKMYLEFCLQQRRHFSPFIASVDGLLGVEATATLKRIASRLATKWKQPYSKTCGYVNSRVTNTLVRANHCCIQGS